MTRGFETLEIYREMDCGWVTFSRPKVMNAFDRRQWTELNEALADFEQDEAIRCVVLRGSGGNFSSGYDLPAALAELAGVAAPGQIESCVRRWARKLGGFSSEVWYANKLTVNRSYEIMGFAAAIAMGEDAFVALSFIQDSFKTELFDRVRRDGFSSAIKWAQTHYE
jgi:hypothetical protein